MEMTPIAHIETDLPQKFGIPRNSFLAPHLQGRIVFEPEFSLPQAVAGLEEFSHLWLLWEFENGTPGGTAADIALDTAAVSKPGTTAKWTPPCARPVWAAPSVVASLPRAVPFGPIPSGLTCVKLDRIEIVDGAPGIMCSPRTCATARPFSTSSPTSPSPTAIPRPRGLDRPRAMAGARGRFPRRAAQDRSLAQLAGLIEVLRQDPRRAGSKHEPERVYHLAYAGLDVAFTVDGESLRVVDIT